MRLIPVVLLFSTLLLSRPHLHEFGNTDLRPGGIDNVCTQTAEFFEGSWYPLTFTQRKEAKKLLLTMYNRDRILFGGILCEHVDTEGSLEVYKGKSEVYGSLLVMVDITERPIINIKLGNLHMKEYTCKPRYKRTRRK